MREEISIVESNVECSVEEEANNVVDGKYLDERAELKFSL